MDKLLYVVMGGMVLAFALYFGYSSFVQEPSTDQSSVTQSGGSQTDPINNIEFNAGESGSSSGPGSRPPFGSLTNNSRESGGPRGREPMPNYTESERKLQCEACAKVANDENRRQCEIVWNC